MDDFLKKLSDVFVTHKNGTWRLNLLILAILALPVIWLGYHWDNYPLDFLNFRQGIYNKDFWQNCLVNFHTSLVDFLLLTLIAERIAHKIKQTREEQLDKLEQEQKAQVEKLEREQKAQLDKAERERRAQDEIRIINEYKMMVGFTAQAQVSNHEAFFALLHLSSMNVDDVRPDSFDLSELIFSEYQSPLPYKFDGFNLSQSGFKDCKLKQWEFENCRMKNFEFSGAHSDLQNFKFKKCDMLKSNFEQAKIQRSIFDDCALSKARFTATNMKYNEFNNCNFDEAVFEKADVSYCKFWERCPTLAQFDQAAEIFPITVGGVVCKNQADLVEAYGTGVIAKKP